VAEGDLGLPVRPEEGQLAGAAYLREPLRDAMRGPRGHRHELWGLRGRETEHDALVTGSQQIAGVVRPALTVLLRLVDAVCDVAGLFPHGDAHSAGRAVESHIARGVADPVDDVADDRRDVGIGIGADLAGDMDQPRGDQRLDRDARAFVLRDQPVEDAVGDLVADLVGVAFRHGLGREKAQGAHRCSIGCGRDVHAPGVPRRDVSSMTGAVDIPVEDDDGSVSRRLLGVADAELVLVDLVQCDRERLVLDRGVHERADVVEEVALVQVRVVVVDLARSLRGVDDQFILGLDALEQVVDGRIDDALVASGHG
ncbi:hypothetical protein ABE10_00250, partial [Bacillus toyonensis]|nr:hypothetical protein [Bacillus toyonensis]